MVRNDTHNVLICAGAGDDIVDNYDANASIGDGNDVIFNCGSNDRLSISGADYSTQISGSTLEKK